MSARTTTPQSARRIFAWPLAIALAGIAGLVLGLTGDGMPDAAAWLLIGVAPAIIVIRLLAGSRAGRAHTDQTHTESRSSR